MKDISIGELKDRAQDLRRKALTMIYEAQSGHPGGAFSAAEVVTYLYFKEMNIDPKNPEWPDRDRCGRVSGAVRSCRRFRSRG